MEQVVIENPVINSPFVEPARTLTVPAVNNYGGFGRWAFLEVTDPWDAQNTIRATVRGAAGSVVGAGVALTPDPSPAGAGEGSLE